MRAFRWSLAPSNRRRPTEPARLPGMYGLGGDRARLDGRRRRPLVPRLGGRCGRAPAGTSASSRSATPNRLQGDANPDVMGTLQQAIARINALQPAPASDPHGDITHAQKPGAFDTVTESLKGDRPARSSTSPARTTSSPTGARSTSAATAGRGRGWQSFDYKGVHFIGLVNVVNFKAGRLGASGQTSSNGSRRTWRALAAARRSWCSPTCRSGPCIPSGDGARRMPDGPSVLSQALRLGHGAQRPHPPDHAEGGGQHHLPHRHVHGVPPAGTGRGPRAGADEGPGGALRAPVRHSRSRLYAGDGAGWQLSIRPWPRRWPISVAARLHSCRYG